MSPTHNSWQKASAKNADCPGLHPGAPGTAFTPRLCEAVKQPSATWAATAGVCKGKRADDTSLGLMARIVRALPVSENTAMRKHSRCSTTLFIRKPFSIRVMRTQTQTARRWAKWTSNKLLQPRLCCSRPARVLRGLRIRTAGGKDL